MKTKVIIERGTDGLYSFYMDNDSLDFALNGQGNTVEEARKEFLLTYQEIKEMYQEEGKTVPELNFEYEYDVASFLNYYNGILSKSGLEKITGINQKQLWHYSSGKRKPSRETVMKIQDGLTRFAKDIEQVHFIN